MKKYSKWESLDSSEEERQEIRKNYEMALVSSNLSPPSFCLKAKNAQKVAHNNNSHIYEEYTNSSDSDDLFGIVESGEFTSVQAYQTSDEENGYNHNANKNRYNVCTYKDEKYAKKKDKSSGNNKGTCTNNKPEYTNSDNYKLSTNLETWHTENGTGSSRLRSSSFPERTDNRIKTKPKSHSSGDKILCDITVPKSDEVRPLRHFGLDDNNGTKKKRPLATSLPSRSRNTSDTINANKTSNNKNNNLFGSPKIVSKLKGEYKKKRERSKTNSLTKKSASYDSKYKTPEMAISTNKKNKKTHLSQQKL